MMRASSRAIRQGQRPALHADGLAHDAISFEKKPDYIETPSHNAIVARALAYLQAGFAVHFTGCSGVGKTALAMHLAASVGRPAVFVQGDHQLDGSDLIGKQQGCLSTTVVDNYVHSVMKKEERTTSDWSDNPLATACRYGYTFIYDEFSRSRPETNNVLLPVLGERLLILPGNLSGERYIQVHPEFNAIFTSNPQDYAGVHKTQDALRDRMITIRLDHYDEITETRITHAKSQLTMPEAALVVSLIRQCRALQADKVRPTIRACMVLGKMLSRLGSEELAPDSCSFSNQLKQICTDILGSEGSTGSESHEVPAAQVAALIDDFVQDFLLLSSTRAMNTEDISTVPEVQW